MPPTPANGKICYVEIPAVDVRRSAEFYERVFGWRIRQRGDGRVAFDDPTEEVSGTWVTGRPPSPEPGLLLYVMVDSVAEAVDAVLAQGGEIAADRRGRARDHREVPRPGRQHGRPLPGARGVGTPR